MGSDLEQLEVCCASYEQMEYQSLVLDQETAVRIDSTAAVFRFDGGKSYFQAFRLPDDLSGRDLVVTSYSNGVTKFDWSTFYPQFVILGRDYRFSRAITDPGVRYQNDMLRGGNWATRVRLEPGDTHLIIHTSPALRDYGVPYPESDGHVAMSGTMPIYVPGTSGGLVQLAPVGKLTLRFVERQNLGEARGRRSSTPLPRLEDTRGATLAGSSDKRSLTDWDTLTVLAIDGQRVDYRGTDQQEDMPIAVAPGPHALAVYFRTTRQRAGKLSPLVDTYLPLQAEMHSGRRYRVIGYLENDAVTAWVEDLESGARASEEVTVSIYWQRPMPLK
jgi:hypothetical protein